MKFCFVIYIIYVYCSEAFADHTSGTRQLQVNPPMAGPRFSPDKSSERAVTPMGFNCLVVGEDHIVGLSLPAA